MVNVSRMETVSLLNMSTTSFEMSIETLAIKLNETSTSGILLMKEAMIYILVPDEGNIKGNQLQSDISR